MAPTGHASRPGAGAGVSNPADRSGRPSTAAGNSEASQIGPAAPAAATSPVAPAQVDATSGGAHVAVAAAATPDGRGFWVAFADGAVTAIGSAAPYGDMSGTATNAPMVGIAATSDGRGYWLLGSDGGVFSFGDATFAGSTGNLRLTSPALQMATPGSSGGYWFVAGDGGVFSFGGAQFRGSTGGLRLNRPVVGIASTRDGGGYWLAASDGGIFTFGSAGFHGSTGSTALARPVVAITPTPSGQGYWMVAADGGVFSFGDAAFHGSAAGQTGGRAVVGMVATAGGGGYWLVLATGAVLAYGDASPLGQAPSPVSAGGVGGASSEHVFEVADAAGRPIRWNPCRSIHYSVLSSGAPAGWVSDVASAVAQVSAATGLILVSDGTYTGSSAVPSTTAITISWTSSLMGGDNVGITNYRYILDPHYTPQIVGADIQVLRSLAPGGGTTGELPVLLHEMGHAMGLAHTTGHEVMNGVDQGLSAYQAGDLAGMGQLGVTLGCAGFFS